MTFRQFNVESITQATNTGAKSFLPHIYIVYAIWVCVGAWKVEYWNSNVGIPSIGSYCTVISQ